MESNSFGALAGNFDAVRARLPKAVTDELEAQGAAIKATAKSKFGGYQAGWAPLAGNLIGGSLGIAGGALAPARGLLGLAYQPQYGHTPAQKFHHYLREKAGIEQMKLGPEGTSQALTTAEQVRQNVRGLDMADAIDVIKDLINITGSVKDATHGPLPELLAKFRVTNRAAYGLTAFEGYSAIRAAEMLTPQQEGMTGEEREHDVGSRLELINKVMGGSGGKILSAGSNSRVISAILA